VLVPATLLVRPHGGVASRGTAVRDDATPPRGVVASDAPVERHGLLDRPVDNGPTARPVDTAVGRRGAPTLPADGPPALPVRVRRPHQGPPAGAPHRAAGPHPNGAPVRPAESDWSTTVEPPVSPVNDHRQPPQQQ